MDYTVSQVNAYIKRMFDEDCILNNIHVKGEVSDCKYHSSGHIYFSLKDEKGQIACVMFAGLRKGLAFRLEKGQSVVVNGYVSTYERDGKYQLYAREIILDGFGILYQRFEELKVLLRVQGLFDEEHKKKIPQYATKVGIVTASTGAALQDIINVSKRRNPYISLYLCPAIVQGEEAPASIVNAIKILDKNGLDVIIVGRGGGSIADLWAFNEEAVARAIFDCETPIISAVGHETDVTISDYVSDLRAPTPSAAAELATFDYEVYERKLKEYNVGLNRLLAIRVDRIKAKIDNYKLRLVHAGPAYKMQQYRQYISEIQDKLLANMKIITDKTRYRLNIDIEKLNGLSPINKLKHGGAIITDKDKKLINSVDNVSLGDIINVTLIDGEIEVVVNSKKRGQII